MKKKRLLLITACLIAVAGFTTACKSNCNEEGAGNETPLCVAPELTLSDEGILWASVIGAQSYQYKYGDGEWETATDRIAYPTSAGEYVVYVKAVDEQGRDGNVREHAFSVQTMTVTCEQIDNALNFVGDNVYYTVNGGEEGLLGESKTIDFSAAEIGTEYTVEYYAKGGFWSEAENTYYLDSAKATKSLKTTKMLSTPVLQVNEAGTHLVWTASENATAYQVTVDGEAQTVEKTAPTVALPTTVGTHTIAVQAIGNGTEWTASKKAEFTMTTKRESVASLTYDSESNTVVWPTDYEGKMLQAINGGNFTVITGTAVTASTNLTLKVASYYDEVQKTLCLESKPVTFQARNITNLTFHTDGYIDWNPTDEADAEKYYVSLGVETAEKSYAVATNNVRNVSSLTAGKYVLDVYAADYIKETENAVIFYLPGAAQSLAFTVLSKPELSFEYGKLLWTVDESAAGYEYKIGDGEWETATDNGVLRTMDMNAYSVRAIGSGEAGKYSLTSEPSSLFFDPNLQSVDGVRYLASFDNESYIQNAGALSGTNATNTGKTEIISSADDTADEAEKAILSGANGGVLKVTAGKANPRVAAHWGNSDGTSFTLFQPLTFEKDAKLVLRVYVVPNEARTTAAVYNYSGEPVNLKDRTLDANGNVYAFFNEAGELVGYQNNSNAVVNGAGEKVGTFQNGKAIGLDGTTVLAGERTVYGVLDDNDVLLGIAQEDGSVVKDGVTVGTLNDKRELVNASGTVLSTSAVIKTKNIEGFVSLGTDGTDKTTGQGITRKETWYNNPPIAAGEWVEVEVLLSSVYFNALSDIRTVNMNFITCAKEGDSFYIDEIRYEEVLPTNAPTFLKENGDIGASYYEVAGPSWVTPIVTEGEDELGKYLHYDGVTDKTAWGMDVLTFDFDGLTLNAGDKVYLHTYTPTGSRWPEIWVNGEKTAAFLTRGEEETIVAFTATEETTLNTVTIHPQKFDSGYKFEIKVYGVYVVRAE